MSILTPFNLLTNAAGLPFRVRMYSLLLSGIGCAVGIPASEKKAINSRKYGSSFEASCSNIVSTKCPLLVVTK